MLEIFAAFNGLAGSKISHGIVAIDDELPGGEAVSHAAKQQNQYADKRNGFCLHIILL
jgi:hypothetical protein